MIAILATIALSAAAWKRPIIGIGLFFFAFSGLQYYLQSFRIMGPEMGPLRADNIAPAIAILSLLQRKRKHNSNLPIEISMWSISVIVPIAVYMMSATTYVWAAGCWRAFYWGPLYSALIRLDDREARDLRMLFVGSVFITSIISIYLYLTGNVNLYAMLSYAEGEEEANVLALGYQRGMEYVRMALPGIYAFGVSAVFVSLGFVVEFFLKRKKIPAIIAVVVTATMVITISLTISRAVAIGLGVGAVFSALIATRISRIKELVVVTIVAVGAIALGAQITRATGVATVFAERMYSDQGFGNIETRLQNNLQYLDILLGKVAIIGHPGFSDSHLAVGGYNDVIGPISMWWHYGLLAALFYIFVMLRIIAALLRANRPWGVDLVGDSTAVGITGAIFGLAAVSVSGFPAISFDWIYITTYMLAEGTRVSLRSVATTRPRKDRGAFLASNV